MTEVDPNRVIQFMASEAAKDRERIARLSAEVEFLQKQLGVVQAALMKETSKPIHINTKTMSGLPQRVPGVNRQES
jgi:hypothetical protein